jgi:hypothetical protein
MTTRAMPAAMMASVQEPSPVATERRAHGSSVTYMVAPRAAAPA